MNPLQPLLAHNRTILLDGGLATELECHGADLNDPLWSAKLLLEDPALIRRVHFDYLAAGAKIISSASYQATFEGFAQRGLNHAQAADLMRLSVHLARQAVSDYQTNNPHHAALVAASVGPYGAYLADGSEYRGDYGKSLAELMDFHRPRLAVLIESGVDLLACETIPCLVEAEALVRLLAEYPKARAWLSFTCKDGLHLWHGETFAQCARLAEECEQVVAVGVNCTAPQYVESLLRSAQGLTSKPLLAYPNLGETWRAADNCWLPGSGVEDFAQESLRWRAAGARLIGGCCRTTPETIRALASILV